MGLEMDEFTLLANFLAEYPDYDWVTATDAYNCLSANPLATPADLYWFVNQCYSNNYNYQD